MSTVQSAAFTRELAEHMVCLVEKQTGSRMTAYSTVGDAIGTSASWLRKFIAGREIKEPGWTTGWNILGQYDRICSRVEASIEIERAKTEALKERINAVTAAVDRVMAGASRETASRARLEK